jgi:membrane protein
MTEYRPNTPRNPRRPPGSPTALRVAGRTISKAWDDSIFGMSAQAAFWQTLSLPPLLLGLLGSIGYVGTWFGPRTPAIVEDRILLFSRSVFSQPVVDQIIAPTVRDILQEGRGGIVSVGFVLSLWAGSSAISSFVESIVVAHGQDSHRHPVWQRIFALLLYAVGLLLAVFTLPLVAVGPDLLSAVLPDSWQAGTDTLVQALYYPAVVVVLLLALTSLYKLALPRPLPWHRLVGGAVLAVVFFVAASGVLRWYLAWVTSTGYSYGALAAPIAYLLFTFFLGFAIVLGAEFNATVQEFWPARATRLAILRERVQQEAAGSDAVAVPRTGPMTGPLSTHMVRLGSKVPAWRARPSGAEPAQPSPPERRPS